MNQVKLLLVAIVICSAAAIAQQPTNASASAKRLEWIEPQLFSAPQGRCCMGLAFDPKTHSTLMFGGFTNPIYLNDTWVWDNGWTELSPSTAPSPRQGPGMVYDAAAGNVVLFGGTDSSGTFLNDTWIWDGVSWTQLAPPVSPPPRRFDTQGLAYDAATRTVVMFGGLTSETSVIGDTWVWNGITRAWTQRFPPNSPSPRRAAIAYDPLTATVLLFGGDTTTTSYNDTWVWNGITWVQRFPASSPSPRGMQGMAFDQALRSIVIFGGVAGPGTQSNDTWLWYNKNWHPVSLPNNPVARWAAGMAYDPITRSMLLFGGFGTHTLDDTWLLF